MDELKDAQLGKRSDVSVTKYVLKNSVKMKSEQNRASRKSELLLNVALAVK